ncbi:unnamed protein product [Acanthoscelides obtectus]|uniref:U6 small nuclear RNA (adenine-(43)-N(6))-methyltransferase n=1 Tax=Acanthoscelides obtectus TaxID=200917 RepID=A0A9P0KYH5_ACAOB|nr:unnamed protein product [Acanthoscelides obtectus]CAK1666185.1 U6 small nuclear RNA (adenine-(43)-N(6))-methyltransferase [Acanthoscelides obtectus]
MSMNKYMHPRNIYKTPPDFKQLAAQFPEFKGFLKLDITGKLTLDFKDTKCLRALSQTLLKKDFGLDVEMPLNKLIPTIPLRLNYILWLEDLLSLSNEKGTVKGIDIGTGASCVYPLIAAKKNKWSMLATEVDDESLKCAELNVKHNGMDSLITVIKVSQDTLLKEVDTEKVDFCMCNPPFFGSVHELNPYYSARKTSRPRPKNSFCATVNEVVVQGGEVEFITKLINESKELGTKIKIYSTMIGHKNSLPPLKKLLRETEVKSFSEAEFCQGNTTRWGLAWTFCDNFDLKKCINPSKAAVKPNKPKKPLIYTLKTNTVDMEKLHTVDMKLQKIFVDLEMNLQTILKKKNSIHYLVVAFKNTWSHQRRKKREEKRKANDSGENNNDIKEPPSPVSQIIETDVKSPGKRVNENEIEGHFVKKLKISDDAEPLIEFNCDISILGNEIVLQIDTISENDNKDYLHQIMQYIKNNLE